ncbi:MAG TPA: beta-L-arabinofuranosidase domain-containing protein, partial [Gemmataceae bacterium]|nr:beta-L-arabinofuranosidase domain-containing protein [Gemmataceae bacterium]
QGDANARPFRDPLQFEAYNLGHLMTAACVRQRLTGRNDLLDVARKAADFLDATSRNPSPEFARCAICPSHYMGLVELYRTTNEPRYLDLAKRLFALRDTIRDGTDDNQDRVPFRGQKKAAGHAVRANYLYAGAADLYAEGGDRTLLAPLTAIWDDLVATKLAITGGCGPLFDGASPDGSKEQRQIGRVHQAYGRDYQLPMSTAHNETCAAVGLALWAWRMLQITGEAKYADVLELVLHNAVLAGVSLDGTSFFYTNTLRQLDSMPAELRWSRTRQPYISSFCCPPNVARIVAESSGFAYGLAEKTVWVHLYGASELAADVPGVGRVKLTQQTDYPWDGRVKLTVDVDRPATFAVQLRVPGWARGASVAVNGAAEPAMPGVYRTLEREWRTGDTVSLTLPMAARLVEAHPLVEEARNQVAVLRGPLVYCVESTDLPAGVGVQDVALPAEIDLKPRFDTRLLGGVSVLEGRAAARPAAAWERKLYRDATPGASKPIEIRLVPYFAWANRGRSEMTVWMPVAR